MQSFLFSSFLLYFFLFFSFLISFPFPFFYSVTLFLPSFLLFFHSLLVFSSFLYFHFPAVSDSKTWRSGEFIPGTTSPAFCSSANDRWVPFSNITLFYFILFYIILFLYKTNEYYIHLISIWLNYLIIILIK